MEQTILLAILIALNIFILMKKSSSIDEQKFRQEMTQSTQDSIKNLGEYIISTEKIVNEAHSEKISSMDKSIAEKQEVLLSSVSKHLSMQEERFKTFSLENEQKLENIRDTVEKKLTYIREDNNKKLDEMRLIVDEKLQKTLEDRMTKSFQLVNERLEQVYKGLGEMQTLASGVGDLKKVLTNVKTRGILGEIQLGAILEEILAPEQYETNFATRKGSKNIVEYAVKLPTENGETIYLPIDSKFPGDTYANLKDAYERGNTEEINQCVKALIQTIKLEAKEIKIKYIDPPNTTDFAIMFLPFEGLYAEVVNRGLIEILQREYSINIAGPSTMAALLNSLQMGFKAFAIQKHSSEVWTVLGAVKTEFEKFSSTLIATQNRLEQAQSELDKLVGVRTRQIQKKLKDIESISASEATVMLEQIEEDSDYDD